MKELTFVKGLKAISQITTIINQLKDDVKYSLIIKEYRPKRSLSANAYYWVLLEKISKVLQTSKDELHEIMLQRYGTFWSIDGVVQQISSKFEINPLECGVHCKFIGESELNGTVFYHYNLIKGSSKYDSKEMSNLINGVVSEAKELEIETLTPEELELLKYE